MAAKHSAQAVRIWLRNAAALIVTVGTIAFAVSSGSVSQERFAAHVASVRQQDQVAEAYADLQQKFPRIIGGARFATSRITLPSGEVWQRLLIGPMESQAEVERFCRALRSEGHSYCTTLSAEGVFAVSPLVSPVPSATPSVEAPVAPLSPAPPVTPGVATARHALVIGISRYKYVPILTNPRKDAIAVSQALRNAGFTSVTTIHDSSAEQMKAALSNFKSVASSSDVASIYFAGHGMEIDGQNYLIPVDARIEEAARVENEAITLESVLAALEGARLLKLVILDACRDNPFIARLNSEAARSLAGRGRQRAYNDGLAPVATGKNTLVAYAAKHGSTASDGEGANSPYATALLEQLGIEGLEVGLLFRRIRDRVMSLTGLRQEPFTYGSISGDAIYIYPVSGGIELPSHYGRYEEYEREVIRRVREVVALIGSRNLAGIAAYVHPTKGVRITPNGHVDPSVDQIVTRQDLLDPTLRDNRRDWGNRGPSDEKIVGTAAEYLSEWAYIRDYASLGKVSFMDRQPGPGEKTNNIYATYPGSLVFDFQIAGSEEFHGMDWDSLRVVFQDYNGRWFIVGILNSTWQP